jgi:hypothetical protein
MVGAQREPGAILRALGRGHERIAADVGEPVVTAPENVPHHLRY